MSVATTASTYTERAILDLLTDRYTHDAGNGPRYVVAKHVRSHAGFDARRTADFMALDVWPSSGMPLHGFEVKVSRSDWLRELRAPEKSAEFMRLCDYWWLAAAPGVARAEELPAGWGMVEVVEVEAPSPTLFRGYDDPTVMVPTPTLKVRRQAPRLQVRDGQRTLPRTFTVALLRAVSQTYRRRG